MKFVKENLTLVICGAVILLSLVFAFVPVPFMAPALRDDVKADIQTRYDTRKSIQTLANTPLELPGVKSEKGVPTQGWVDAKQDLIDNIDRQQKAVDLAAQQLNMINRFDEKAKAPLLPIPNNIDPARMTATPMPGYVPAATADRMAFKEAVEKTYRLWIGLLSSGAMTVANYDAAIPPRADAIKADLDERARLQQAGSPTGLVAPGMTMGQDSQELWRAEKIAVTNKAASLRMYVEPNALQMRQWYVGPNPPTDEEIFDAFVDCWFQSDVVKAILKVNGDALASVPDKNVGKAPIKRLTRIMVGVNARARQLGTSQIINMGPGGGQGPVITASDPGPIFLTVSNASGAAMVGGGGAMAGPPMTPTLVNQPGGGVVTIGGGQPAAAAPQDQAAPANEIKYEMGMTGRSAGADYDVVPMSVIMDIDPAYLNKFIDQLYRQNMSYTVTNIQFKTVDPLDRASNGYLYGDGQVIEVELQFEGILFRSWTQPLMPARTKQALGIGPKS